MDMKRLLSDVSILRRKCLQKYQTSDSKGKCSILLFLLYRSVQMRDLNKLCLEKLTKLLPLWFQSAGIASFSLLVFPPGITAALASGPRPLLG